MSRLTTAFITTLAEAQLLEAGFEETMVHFAEAEAPLLLFPAVQQHLNESVDHNPILVHSEKQ